MAKRLRLLILRSRSLEFLLGVKAARNYGGRIVARHCVLAWRLAFEGRSPGESGRSSKLSLDPQQLIELGNSLAATA
jgi:hypothetical protein